MVEYVNKGSCLSMELLTHTALCNSSSIPLSLSAVVTDPVDLDLHARLLSDEIDCDFNHGTFCQLHNNGGWSFRQSLLEHDQINLSIALESCRTDYNRKIVNHVIFSIEQGSSDFAKWKVGVSNAIIMLFGPTLNDGDSHSYQESTGNASFPALSKPNHYICADWGETSENTSSEESTRSAELQAFISLPSPRQNHPSSGSVLYLGAGPVWSLWTVDKDRERYSQKLGLCLDLNVRFLSHDASKLTVKFRSSSQTIEAKKMPGPRAVLTTAPSFKESHSSSLHSLPERQSSHHLKPPTDQWLHFTMPLDTQFFHPESPLPFTLYGYNGVCVDSIRVERCATTILSSLSWPPNNTLYLALSHSPTKTLSSTNNNTEYFNHPLFTGAFLFTVLLVVLLVLLVLICVLSVVCGRKRSSVMLKKKGRMEHKKVPLVLPSMDLMRSPSVSSLPAAVVHQRQSEISYSINNQYEETPKHADCPDDDRRRRHGDLRQPQKRPLRRPQSVFGDGGRLHSGRPQKFRREISEQFPSLSTGRRDKRQLTAPLLLSQRFNWRRSTESNSDAINAINSRNVFQRFSLLLSINENNELVLISPEIANASFNERSARIKDGSSSSAAAKNAATGFVGTSGSSISTSTSYITTTTTTPAGTCSSGRLLSSLEAEATLQEMAASVSQLGREFVGKRNDENDDESDSNPSVVESITSSIAYLSRDLRLTEQKSLYLS
ncbi:hypothetical protein ACTXT7_015564 [Hymenolepis weldensis]